MKKFELTNESIWHYDRTLYRIRALKNFSNVMKGDLGGFVENENNLSQQGDCWIYNDAKALDNSRIYDNVLIFDNVLIYDNVTISGNVRIFGSTVIFDDVEISDNVRIYDNVKISNNVRIYYNAEISGNTKIYGNAKIKFNAVIKSNKDWISIGPIGSEYGILTAYKLNNGDIGITRDCFSGTLETFIEQVNEVHKDNEFGKDYRLAVELIKSKLNN